MHAGCPGVPVGVPPAPFSLSLSTAIAGNGLELEEHDTRSERITRDLELGRSIATQPIWFLAALEIKLILDRFFNIGRAQNRYEPPVH